MKHATEMKHATGVKHSTTETRYTQAPAQVTDENRWPPKYETEMKNATETPKRMDGYIR